MQERGLERCRGLSQDVEESDSSDVYRGATWSFSHFLDEESSGTTSKRRNALTNAEDIKNHFASLASTRSRTGEAGLTEHPLNEPPKRGFPEITK